MKTLVKMFRLGGVGVRVGVSKTSNPPPVTLVPEGHPGAGVVASKRGLQPLTGSGAVTIVGTSTT
jgi:hypothetical protein